MTDNLVRLDFQPPAAVITLNRPDKRNALSRALIAGLREAFEKARDEKSIRCVILTGAGPAFCAGMDLAELQATLDVKEGQDPREAVWDDTLHLGTLYDLIYTLPKPTIAAINGPALAGGAGLVTVCDLALAVPEARLGYPEVRRGLVAALVMPHLLRHAGERAARYLLLTGEVMDAEEAQRSGLINRVVPSAQLLEQAHRWAKSLAEGGPGALAGTKELLKTFSRQALSVEEAARASAAPRFTEECQAGLRAFFAKKPAPWAPPGTNTP
ncbi:MAG: enoyl-CoA hydratase/isomerase family protein [Planctomycetes bacterium]|nr:enoyl-CoA hydratase/isomerase family protein [Planctomycetota bacterium]